MLSPKEAIMGDASRDVLAVGRNTDRVRYSSISDLLIELLLKAEENEDRLEPEDAYCLQEVSGDVFLDLIDVFHTGSGEVFLDRIDLGW